jgi:hypothetical protein
MDFTAAYWYIIDGNIGVMDLVDLAEITNLLINIRLLQLYVFVKQFVPVIPNNF